MRSILPYDKCRCLDVSLRSVTLQLWPMTAQSWHFAFRPPATFLSSVLRLCQVRSSQGKQDAYAILTRATTVEIRQCCYPVTWAVWPRVSYFSFLNLSFLTCKVRDSVCIWFLATKEENAKTFPKMASFKILSTWCLPWNKVAKPTSQNASQNVSPNVK